MKHDIQYIVVDLFAGAGGVTTGIENARIGGRKIAKVIAAVNHDANAIASHALNHPDAIHFTEDIRLLNLEKLLEVVIKAKKEYPNALLILWASAECTNYSKAKGGVPRNADSRTLPESIYRYIDALNPDIIQLENVIEFMSWGPLDENGRPESRKAGREYLKWVATIKSKGYDYDYRTLDAANYGAYTSRERYFGMFTKENIPIVWPDATHSKKAVGTMFEKYERWKPVKEVLDFSDEGESIFTRKTPLVEKTLERIYAGLVKFVAGGGNTFVSKYFSGHPESKNHSIDEPAGAITTKDHHSLVKCNFLSGYYGTGHNCTSVNKPCPTVTTKDRLALVSPRFIDQQFGQGKPASIEKPLGAITTIPKYNLISCKHWIMDTSFANVGSSINEPVKVITANRKWHYLMNPQYMSQGSSIDHPCFCLIARMDKAPPYLICAENGTFFFNVKDTDSQCMQKIKRFMVLYDIVDIKMRMLRMVELKLIMGFPKDYQLIGTQADQKKFIGNAVVTLVPQRWYEAMALRRLEENKLTAA